MKCYRNAAMLGLATLVLAFSSGCGKSAADRLVGTWAMDFSDVAEQMMAEQGGEAGDMAAEMLRPMIEQMVQNAKMEVTFNSDGTVQIEMSMMGDSESASGTWEVVESDGDRLVISTNMEQEEGTERLEINFVDSDTFRMKPPNEDVPFEATFNKI